MNRSALRALASRSSSPWGEKEKDKDATLPRIRRSPTMTRILFCLLLVLPLLGFGPVHDHADHAAPALPDETPAQAGKDIVLNVPPKDSGAETLEARGQAERASVSRFKVFHDFRFTDRLPESGITFVHQIVDD